MCSGRVEPDLVLKAFREGADGVLIAGCHPGECHYTEGNLKALRRYSLLKRLVAQFGIEPQRLQLLWASASEGSALAEKVNNMTEELRLLGPLRWRRVVAGLDLAEQGFPSGNGRTLKQTEGDAAKEVAA
jgi:F420-non-reducing hydrogenase iron-sulfur subunit